MAKPQVSVKSLPGAIRQAEPPTLSCKEVPTHAVAARLKRLDEQNHMRICSCSMKAATRSVTRKSRKRSPAVVSSTDELDQVFAVVAHHFRILSEPTRLKILHTICQDERSVSAIVAATGATQTNVSRHLALMHHAGIVARRRAGNTVYYRVADAEFVEICRSVCIQIASRIDEQKPLRKDLLQFAARH